MGRRLGPSCAALCRLQVHKGNVVSGDRVFMAAKQLRGFYQSTSRTNLAEPPAKNKCGIRFFF